MPSGYVKGHMLATEPSMLRLPACVTLLVTTQLEDGRLLVGGTVDPTDSSPQVQPAAIARLRSQLSAGLPAVGQVASHTSGAASVPGTPMACP